MATHEIFGKRLFWQVLKLPKGSVGPIVSLGTSTMTEPPFRRATPLVLRVPFTTHVLAVGIWRDTDWDEETALLNALSGWGFDPFEGTDPDRDMQQVRETLGAQNLDLDDEWRILTSLGAAD